MDKYDHYLAYLAMLLLALHPHASGYAITIGQTTYYSCSKDQVDIGWRAHEDCHKQQWARDGCLKFAFLYAWYSLTRGYNNNPYEIEAEQARIAAEEAESFLHQY